MAAICDVLQKLFGVVLKLNTFNVKVLTMHRWFDIKASEQDLKFEPIIGLREGWDETIVWFKENWLPLQSKSKGLGGISKTTQNKIDIQDESSKKVR